jgi:hypothetical protein
MFVQALQYGTGIVSAEELEGDAGLPARHPRKVWVSLVKSLAGLRVVAQAVFQVVSQAGVDVGLELQA